MSSHTTKWESEKEKGEPDIKVRESRENTDRVTGDKYTPTWGGEHIHESYNLNKSTGEYKQYSGGEKSSDRSYNKKDK